MRSFAQVPLKIMQSSGCADRFNRLQETTKHVDQGNHTVDGFKKQLLFSFSLFPGSMSVLYLICDLVLDSIALPGPAHRRDPWVPHLHRNLRMAWSLLSHQQMQRPGSFQDCPNSTMTMGRSCLELWGSCTFKSLFGFGNGSGHQKCFHLGFCVFLVAGRTTSF